jgi:hypothetical protein
MIFYHQKLFAAISVSCAHLSANENTFVCCDGKLMPEIFLQVKFLEKPTSALVFSVVN